MNRDLDKFLNVIVPGRGYHAFNGQIELYSEKNLTFECPCLETHAVNSTVALIDFPLENKGMYVCPNRELLFVMVKATGILSVKGLKVIGFYDAKDESTAQQILVTVESRKKLD